MLSTCLISFFMSALTSSSTGQVPVKCKIKQPANRPSFPNNSSPISPMWFFLFYCNVYWRAYRNGLLRRLTPLLSTCRLTELSVALPSPSTSTHSVNCLPIVIVCLSQSQWVGGLPRLPFCDWPQWTATHAAIFIYFLSCPSSSVTGWLFDCYLIP